MIKDALIRTARVMCRECRRMVSRPLYLFCMVIAPLLTYALFTTMMGSGLPTDIPVGVVDQDNTSTSRMVVRNLDAFQQTAVVAHYPDFHAARVALQRGDIYGFFYIPGGTTDKAIGGRQPRVSFYTNNTYLIAGSLLFRDMKTMSELASGAVARETLYAKGYTEAQAMAILQPIIIDTHALNNPWLNYSVYLCNTLLPGVLMLLIFMVTAYSIAVEIKDGTVRDLLHSNGDSIYVVLTGKLLPQTIVFFIMAIAYNVSQYVYLPFPCNSWLGPMHLASFIFVLAYPAIVCSHQIFFSTLRLSLSFASLWGVISFSISGFTFPVMAMHPMLQALTNLFPLRHYFLIYVDQALNGYAMIYSWRSYVALLLFVLLPFLIIRRLKKALLTYTYIP